MKKQKLKPAWGGARKGAGRKKGVAIKPDSERRKKYSLLLSDSEKSALDAMRDGLTPSAYIRQKLGLQ